MPSGDSHAGWPSSASVVCSSGSAVSAPVGRARRGLGRRAGATGGPGRPTTLFARASLRGGQTHPRSPGASGGAVLAVGCGRAGVAPVGRVGRACRDQGEVGEGLGDAHRVSSSRTAWRKARASMPTAQWESTVSVGDRRRRRACRRGRRGWLRPRGARRRGRLPTRRTPCRCRRGRRRGSRGPAVTGVAEGGDDVLGVGGGAGGDGVDAAGGQQVGGEGGAGGVLGDRAHGGQEDRAWWPGRRAGSRSRGRSGSASEPVLDAAGAPGAPRGGSGTR